MDIKEFIKNFADQFDEEHDFSPATVFHDLDDYSSIVALSIIGMVDEEYGVSLTASEMSAAVTVEDLFNTVKSKK